MRRRAGLVSLAGATLLLAGTAVALPGSAGADTRPRPATVPATVSADALPTVQVNGVVWSQAVVGNRVYAGGSFTSARPAGAAPGTHLTRRTNLLAYDIRTGALVASFAHTLNGQVLSVAASPDRKRVYVAATSRWSTAPPACASPHSTRPQAGSSPGSRPVLGARARTGSRPPRPSTSEASSVRRTARPAPAWPPSPRPTDTCCAGRRAPTTASTPWSSRPAERALVVGGRFTTLAGHPAYGLGAVNAVTGTGGGSRPTASSATPARTRPHQPQHRRHARLRHRLRVRQRREPRGLLRRRTARRPLVWIEDCHGDTYRRRPGGRRFYLSATRTTAATSAGGPRRTPASSTAAGVHHRRPGTLGARHRPRLRRLRRQARPVTARLVPRPRGRHLHRPGPGRLERRRDQLLRRLGGEFPSVNGHAQQGLVRFAVSRLAPNKEGPRGPAAALALSGTSGAAPHRCTWTTTYDRDNQLLTYTLTRTGRSTPVWTGRSPPGPGRARCRCHRDRSATAGRTPTG